MTGLSVETAVRIFDGLILSPIYESVLLCLLYVLVRAAGGRLGASRRVINGVFIALACAYAFLTHGALDGWVWRGASAMVGFCAFSVQLLWMRARFSWEMTFYGLVVSHSFANLPVAIFS